MERKRAFSQILEEKMGFSPPKVQEKEHFSEGSRLSEWQMNPFFIPRKTWSTRGKKSKYKIPRRRKRVLPKAPPPPVPSPEGVAYKQLSPEGKSSVTILIGLGAELNKENIVLSELKKSHRNLAKKFHPDLNCSPESHAPFLQLQQNYESLRQEIERLSGSSKAQ